MLIKLILALGELASPAWGDWPGEPRTNLRNTEEKQVKTKRLGRGVLSLLGSRNQAAADFSILPRT
jgi:hypothetical protein